MSSLFHARTLATAVTAFGLAFVLTACGGDEVDDTGAATGTRSSTDVDTKTDGDKDPNEEKSPVLDHEAALAAGFNQELAVTCGYTYDEQELAGLKMMSTSGDVPPEATIYVDRGTVYWDIPEPDGKMSHMLASDGYLYTWKVPGDGEGVKSPDATNGGGDELKQRMAKNAHDCKAYDGPASIFQPPNDITFKAIG